MKRSKYGVRTPESGVLRACLDLLAAEKIWHRRWNTGAVKAEGRFFRFGQKGDADILACPLLPFKLTSENDLLEPCYWWIECKSDTGKQTKEQQAFMVEVCQIGHYYTIARSVDDLKKWMREHGVIKP